MSISVAPAPFRRSSTSSLPPAAAAWPRVPQLQQIAAARGSAELVGVGLPPYGQLAGYAGKHALAFPIAVDDQGEVSKRYRATLTPMLMVLVTDGSVVYKHVGQLDTETVQAVAKAMNPGPHTN